jgi:hypothetical protein
MRLESVWLMPSRAGQWPLPGGRCSVDAGSATTTAGSRPASSVLRIQREERCDDQRGSGRDRRPGDRAVLRVGPWSTSYPLVFGLAALPLTLVGQVRRVARLRRQRLDTTRTPAASPPQGPGRAGLATAFTLPPTLVSFLVALLILYLAWFGELYPLRPDVIAYLGDMFRPFPGGASSWGGPTLVGAWVVHAMVAVGLQVTSLALICGLGADLRAHHPPAAWRVTATPRQSSSSARTSSTCTWAASTPWSASPWTPSETAQRSCNPVTGASGWPRAGAPISRSFPRFACLYPPREQAPAHYRKNVCPWSSGR